MKKTLSQQQKEIGRRFREFRVMEGKTVTQVAEETSYPVAYIEALESGHAELSIYFCEHFYTHSGLSFPWIVRGEGQMIRTYR